MTLTEKVVNLFREINKIPRGSGNEKGISNWLLSTAQKHGWEAIQDDVLNIIIKVPGKGKLCDKETIVLQGHMDMVCVKTDDSMHNFLTDPIEMIEEEGWLKAKDTTLGADNGIAIAIALFIAMEEGVAHPPLELLFTVDEERGLLGANNLKSGILKGKYLINIDSEEEGFFTIGCAGGVNTYIDIPLEYKENTQKLDTFEISISKLSGGHSGTQIHQNKSNAIQYGSRILNKIISVTGELNICTIRAGIAHNAIPTNILIQFCNDNGELVKKVCHEMFDIFKKEDHTYEPMMEMYVKKVDTAHKYIKNEVSQNIALLLMSLPHGVFSMSRDMSDLVETSNNLAQISSHNVIDSPIDFLRITLSQRSSVGSKLDFLTEKIECLAKLAGAKVHSGTGYPAWEPDWNSELLKKSIVSFQNIFKRKPQIKVIHAGLECGVIGSKYPDMEMISIGPDIKNAHTTQEILKIDDLEKVVKFLIELFENL